MSVAIGGLLSDKVSFKVKLYSKQPWLGGGLLYTFRILDELLGAREV